MSEPQTSEPRVTITDSQVGVVGDHAHVEGGIHFHTAPPANSRERRNRAAMLQLVRNTWIKGLLEQSLHGAALIELGLEYRPDAVDHPWDMVVQMPKRPDRQLPPGTRIVEVFDESGGSLLILGEPGSGKTTMLLELARDLIARAGQDETLHIPVVFNLSSWTVKQAPLEEWLIEELRTKYYIPKKVAQAWVKEDTLLLLLDGLDEVKADAREKCLATINAFRERHLVPLAVCSRTANYAALTAKLHTHTAISLRPLTPAQIDAYLAGTGTELRVIQATLHHDPLLREMAESPLFLSVMALAYRCRAMADLQDLYTLEARRQRLFDTYIERMFLQHAGMHPYKPEQACYWLAWLAARLAHHQQSQFFIENLQPDWLPEKEQRLVKGLTRLFLGAAAMLWGGVFVGLAAKTTDKLSAGLVGGLVIALLLEMLVKIDSIKPVEVLTWSWQKVRKGPVIYVFIGLSFSVLIAGLIGILCEGLIIALVFGLSCLFWGLGKSNLATKTTLNQGIRLSARNFMLLALFLGPVYSLGISFLFGLIYPVSLFWSDVFENMFYGSLLGAVVGVFWGGAAVVLHYSLRYMLARNNYLPFRLVPFLDYCVDRIFLRRVGGGYIFIHRMLMEHFASLTPEDIERIAADVEGVRA